MSEMTKDEMRERLGNIEQIRDILFGTQLRESNGRFDQIQSDLSRLQQTLEARIDEVKSSLSNELQAAVDSLEKKIKSVSFTTQKDTVDVRQSVDRLNKKFSSSFDDLTQNVEVKTDSLQLELSKTQEKFEGDVRTLKSYLLDEMEKRLSLMKDSKVSKDDMADILFEMGLKLRETEAIADNSDQPLLESGQSEN